MKIDAIIPAFNESERVGLTIQALKTMDSIGRIIVVDDGSSDATSTVAMAAGAEVIRFKKNRGKSAAVSAGVLESKALWILLLDADLAETATEAQLLVKAVLLDQAADVSIAKFPVVPGRGGGMGLAVKVSRWGSQILGGWKLQAPLSGQRCMKRAHLFSVFPLPYGFGLETALNIRMGRLKYSVIEVETKMDHRVTQNDSNGLRHRLRQLFHLSLVLIREALRHVPT